MLKIESSIEGISQCTPELHNVTRVNSIKKKYPHWRQESKAPTFALTYQGTFMTLMTNCGFSKDLAKSIEASYHKLYVVSDNWVAEKLEQACKDGYITVAFGLRLRTPLLNQVVLGTSKTPFEAAAEGRTAGNALGQSWCMLNSRASTEFMGRVRREKYRLDIKPCAHIHDAQYFLIRDDMDVLQYTNEHLANAVAWQDDPLIANDQIKMSGQLELFHPHWGKGFDIPNMASKETIITEINKHKKRLEEE